jgi:hypothetical protein
VRLLLAPEDGSALIEASFVIPILIVLAIGAAEVGLLGIDYMTVTNAAREGARTGAAAADYTDPGPPALDADDLILEAVEEAACNLRHGELVEVSIYRAEADGSMPVLPSGFVNTYVNSGSLQCDIDGHGLAAGTDCCPWDPATRDREPPSLDMVGVKVVFSHEGVTGLFPFPTVNWTETAVMQIEPDTRGQQ